MRIGMVGLGKMGMNMARRLLQNGQEVVAFNRSPEKVDEIVKEGAIGAYTLKEMVNNYTSGSSGPAAAEDLLKRDGRIWRPL